LQVFDALIIHCCTLCLFSFIDPYEMESVLIV